MTTRPPWASPLVEARLSGLPPETPEHYPAVLEALRPEEVNENASRCRETVAVALLGDSAVVDKAALRGKQ